MNDDHLRERISAIDPAPSQVPVEPATTPSSRARLEQIMNTATTTRAQENLTRNPARWIAAATAVAAIAAIGGVIALNGDGSDAPLAQPPLELSLGDESMASCMMFDAATLSAMSPAFSATATAVDGEMVTLEVDRWYAGGGADTVVLNAQPGMKALIAGFAFEVGQDYLITASDGTVNLCGYSGPASPELTAAFDEAFPSS